MKQDWHPDALAQHFTLAPDEHTLLESKPLTARLGFAVLLKVFQLEARFSGRREQRVPGITHFLARQLGMAETSSVGSAPGERTLRFYKAQIRAFTGLREFTLEDVEPFTAWLAERVISPDPSSEVFKQLAYGRLRDCKLEPPTPERLSRLLRSALTRWETGMFETLTAKLSPSCRLALDALICFDEDDSSSLEQQEQQMLFVVRSDLARLKDTEGAVKVSTVLEELDKLKKLRALELPHDLFAQISPQTAAYYRRRAAGEPPQELRRHSPEVRYTLLAVLCGQRQVEIIDGLIELLIHIAHHIGTRAGSGSKSSVSMF